MIELLNNLQHGAILHTTRNNVNYIFRRRSIDGGIIYSINNTEKTLSLATINQAIEDTNAGVTINRRWYINFNPTEATSRGCNLSVLHNLLRRLQQ